MKRGIIIRLPFMQSSRCIWKLPRLFVLFICVLATCRATAQNIKTIYGIVLDEHNAPLSSVSVTTKQAKVGTITDGSGRFELHATSSDSLVFSLIGYRIQTLAIDGQSTFRVVLLNEEAQALNDVIVVGYGTQKKSDVTGAIASVPKSRLSQIPATNVFSAIEGAIAGMNVTTTSSVPGSTPSMLVRGQNSITASTSPYIIVDGMPLIKTAGNTINDINPNDIASIEILKDASATAIYGVNGSNGVILITTKRGLTGKPIIRYNGYFGLENMAHVLTPLSGPEYVQKYADYKMESGSSDTAVLKNYGEWPNYWAGKTTNWLDLATQRGLMNDHDLSISGGTQDVKYYLGGEYMKQLGVVKGYQYHRANLRANLDINVTKFLTVGMSSLFTANNYDGGRANFLFATAMSPYGTPFNTDGTYDIYPMNPESLFLNPLLGLTTQQVRRTYNFNGNAYAEVKFSGVLSGLKYRLNANYIYYPERYASYTGRADNDLNGTAQIENDHTNNYTIENIISYTKDWGKHHVDFTGLYSAQERKYIQTIAKAVGFANDIFSFNNLGAGTTQSASSYADRYAQNSQMGRLNYTYSGKYLFTATVRRDGSSVMGGNTSKYGVFPSVAAGWNIYKENFMRDVNWVDNLKLRLSYGKTGNEAVGVYKTITTDNSVRYPFSGTAYTGIVAANLGNGDLHWENTKTFNAGLDFSVLKNRIGGTIDFYKGNTSDLLLSRGLPHITGYSSVLANIGKTSNTGIEVSLNTQNVVTENFKWESAIVFAANQNKIVDLYGDKKDDIGNRWFIGHPISVIYDYVMDGVWQTGEDASKQDPGAKPGDLKFKDVSSPTNPGQPDGQITAEDKVILGQTQPKWTGGITNTLHYKNFNLSVFIQTVQGMMKNDVDLSYADELWRRNMPKAIGYWTPDNKNNDFPSLVYTNPRGYGYPRNASYTRIKDVTLSYIFSQKTLEKIHLNNLTVYVSGRNLYTFTNWIGWDPEDNYSTRGSGDWTNNYPLTRTFIFGVNVSIK